MKRLYEGVEHPFDLVYLHVELTMELVGYVAEVSSEQELLLGFGGGACRDAEKASELPFTIATASLGDIGGH